jgi:hypothetical protein
MKSALMPQPAVGVELIPVRDEGILFDQQGQRLFYLNPMATTIWQKIDGSRDIGEISDAVADAATIDKNTARQFVLDMLKAWRRTGLLLDRGDSFPAIRRNEPSEAWLPASSDDLLVPVSRARRRYEMMGTAFSLGFSSETLEAIVHPALAHLSTEMMSAEFHCLDLIEVTGEIRVIHEGKIAGRCAGLENLAPLLHGLLGLLAIRSCRYLMAIHASGLALGENALMLAGKSGSGKTTMAAALMTSGWEYMSDDTMLLLPTSLDAIGVPYSLTIKPGAWPILRPRAPKLEQVPIHIRADNQPVRYLSPPRGDFSHPRAVRWVGFPHRSTTGEASMRHLDHVEGLYRLLEHCCAIPQFLDAEDVRSLTQWSAGIHFFEFATVDIDDAVGQIAALVGSDLGNGDSPPLPTLGDSLEHHRGSMF